MSRPLKFNPQVTRELIQEFGIVTPVVPRYMTDDHLLAYRAIVAEQIAAALCNSSNETEQNGYRRQLGILLCGWPE